MVTVLQSCYLDIIKALFLTAFLPKMQLFCWIMYLFQYVSRLCDTREINKCISSAKSDSKGIPNQGSHSVDDTLEEIKRQGTTATGLWLELSRHSVQSRQSPIIQDVVGIVVMLWNVKDDVLNW